MAPERLLLILLIMLLLIFAKGSLHLRNMDSFMDAHECIYMTLTSLCVRFKPKSIFGHVHLGRTLLTTPPKVRDNS